MHVLITGGAGFLGQRLARAILAAGGIRRDGELVPVDRLTLLDVVAAGDPGDPRVESMAADITDPDALERAIGTETGSVFHQAPKPAACSIWRRSSPARPRPSSTSACASTSMRPAYGIR